MTLIDRIRSAMAPWAGGRDVVVRFTGFDPHGVSDVLGMPPEQVWEEQPYLRTVINFLARNIAQLGGHVFERVSDTDRKRDFDSPLAQLMRQPNPYDTTYELFYGMVADLALFDHSYTVVDTTPDTASGFMINRVPAPWITKSGGDLFGYGKYKVRTPYGAEPVEYLAADVLDLHGWNPQSSRDGASPVESLKGILAEQIEAVNYRNSVWRRGGKISSVITRPTGAKWTDDQRNSFRTDWNSRFSSRAGTDVGGTPILEDGMTINKLDFSAHEQQFVEGAKLSIQMVAMVYHVNPTMIGLLDNANYSNVREFRRALYGDTLGPIITQLENKINYWLIPRLGMDPDRYYFEFNIAEKLQGSFEEQTNAYRVALGGAPYMTVNEVRSRSNLTAIDSGDDVPRPLNLAIGPATEEMTASELLQRVNAASALVRSGYAPDAALVLCGLDPIQHLGLLPVTIQKPVEPTGEEQVDESIQAELTDGADTNTGKRSRSRLKRHQVSLKAITDARSDDALTEVVASFFKRQSSVVLSAMGAKAQWWDEARWNKELAADLEQPMREAASKAGVAALTAAGVDHDYDEGHTTKYFSAVAKSKAKLINGHTKQLLESIDEDDPDVRAERARSTFDTAEGSRATKIAVGLATFAASFGTQEAGEQYVDASDPGDGTGPTRSATKTWIAGANPRVEHAQLDGETVALSDDFSNGMPWPGASGASADDLAGCNCSLDMTFTEG